MPKSLRIRLGKIVIASGTSGYRRWYTPGLFERHVLPLLPKTLQVLVPPPEKSRNYNCFIYALGLHKRTSVLRRTKGFIYSAFVQKLLDQGELVQMRRPSKGDLVLYRNPRAGEEFTHAGVVQSDGSVVSKWSWGPLIRHKMLDVPSFYGSRVTFVKRISPARAERLFRRYQSFNKP